MRVGENNRKDGQSTTIFSITERKKLAYRYFFRMSDEESREHVQADVESCFRCFYCILFKRIALKGHIIAGEP